MLDEFSKFSRDLDKAYQEKVVKATTEFVRTVVITAYRYITANSQAAGLQYGSPVLTGRYYSSHQISLNSINQAVQPPNPKGEARPYSGKSLSDARLVMQNFKLGDTVYISNSLPYARRIENGWSKLKAPRGVYKVAAEAVKTRFKNARLKV